MQRAFIVKLDIDASASVDGIAADIAELVSDDYNVIEVKPWSAQTLQSMDPLPPQPNELGPQL